MPNNYRPLLAGAGIIAVLTVNGCASHPDSAPPPMTQAQARDQLQNIAADPKLPQTARAAAQGGVDQGQAQQMLDQGK